MATVSKQESRAILKSINAYQKALLNDLNLKLRLVGNDEKTYTTTLVRWDDETITLAAPLVQRDWLIFPLPIQMNCAFISKGAICSTTILITRSHRNESGLLYKADIIKPLIRTQQRSSFRLDLLMDMHFKITTSLDGLPLDDAPLHKATCVNISAGGLCMSSSIGMATNQIVELHFNLLDNAFILQGTLLDESIKNDNGTYTNRIKFLDITPTTENLLTRLILEKQRLSLQNTKVPLYKKS